MVIQTAEKNPATALGAPVALENVTKRYGRRRSAVAALDRVSLSFAAGSFTGAAVMVPFYVMSRREPALAPG